MNLNQQINRKTAVAVFAATAAVCIAAVSIYVHSLKKQYAELDAESPESAITEYFRKVNNKEYEELYQEAEQISPDSNSQETYIQELQTVYDGVDTDAIDYQLQSSDDSASSSAYCFFREWT